MTPIAFPDLAFSTILPEGILLTTALVILLIDLFAPKTKPINLTLSTLVGIALAFVSTQAMKGVSELGFSGMILRDDLSLYLDQIFLLGAGLVVLLSQHYCTRLRLPYGEYLVLLLFSTLGMMVIAISADLILLFIGIELLSLSLFVLTGMNKSSLLSGEASVKYFVLGAFSTGFLVYGMAFLFGLFRTTNLVTIGEAIGVGVHATPLLVFGFALVLVGLGFKISLAPFHMWAPDVYQGAPTPITAWIATGSKVAGFIALVRIFSLPGASFQPFGELWATGFWLLAMLTMIIGNAGAMVQKNLKRMLAYSSIAHGGYLSMAFVSQTQLGMQALLFYLMAYVLMTMGAFGVVIAVTRKGEECHAIADLAGLAKAHPLLAGLMAVFMLALAGMPFTVGFFGKLWLFGAAMQSHYYALAIVGILTTLLSFYYYLRVIVFMYMKEADEDKPFDALAIAPQIALGVAAAGVVVLGIFPNWIWKTITLSTGTL
jgi:NADH-quinone oxidoreductase subunit N